MKRNIKRLLALAFTVLLLCGTVFSVSAAISQAPHSLQVNLKYNKEPVKENIEIWLYKVADVQLSGGNKLSYTLTKEFQGAKAVIKSYEDSLKPDTADKLYQYAMMKNLKPLEKKNSGKAAAVSFGAVNGGKDLDEGLFLVCQAPLSGPMSDKNYVFLPALVSMPSPTEDGGVACRIEITPKCDMFEPMALKARKLWKDAKTEDYEKLEVKVQFIGEKKGQPNIQSEVIVLDKDNDWTYVSSDSAVYYPKGYTWKLRELDVPEGYKESYPNGEWHFESGKPPVYELHVENKKIPPKPPLIQTGQLNWPVPLLAGAGLLLILTGVVVTRHGRKKQEQ